MTANKRAGGAKKITVPKSKAKGKGNERAKAVELEESDAEQDISA